MPYSLPPACRKYLTQAPARPDRLRACQEIIPHICFSYENERDGNLSEARNHLAQALALDPENRYLHFLQAQLQRLESVATADTQCRLTTAAPRG